LLQQAEKFTIQQVFASEAIGIDVFYQSAEPCPIIAWIDTEPHSNAPLFSGVVNSGDLSLIQQDLVPKRYKIIPSLCNLKFLEIGNNTTGVQGYVVLLIYFPNTVVISGDAAEARVLCLSVKFQVVEQVPAGFLIGIERGVCEVY
jgi:hypothetical protein